MKRARRRNKKCGPFRALPAPEIYTTEYAKAHFADTNEIRARTRFRSVLVNPISSLSLSRKRRGSFTARASSNHRILLFAAAARGSEEC